MLESTIMHSKVESSKGFFLFTLGRIETVREQWSETSRSMQQNFISRKFLQPFRIEQYTIKITLSLTPSLLFYWTKYTKNPWLPFHHSQFQQGNCHRFVITDSGRLNCIKAIPSSHFAS